MAALLVLGLIVTTTTAPTAAACGHRWDAPTYPTGWTVHRCELPADHEGDHEHDGERHPATTTKET